MVAYLSDFNSIKVRLERILDMTVKSTLPEFQFHKGTIRTLSCYHLDRITSRFQFHKGTIRTR